MSHINTQAIKGKIGTTNYYLAKLKANQLIGLVKPAAELEDWENLSIEEKYQRQPNINRVKKDIAPYLANNKDRFYGSLIVVALNGGLVFESVGDLGAKIPNAYQRDAKDMGFLTIEGGTFAALDGQHRLIALRHVIQGLEGGEGEYQSEVAQDDVSVIFIEEETKVKTRNIFTVVNRYAKSTTAGENYLIDSTDGYAIIARKVLTEGLLPEDKVNIRGSALPERAPQFTTLAAIYEMNKRLVEGKTDKAFEHKQIKPDDIDVDEAWLSVQEYWHAMVDKLDGFKKAVEGKPQDLRCPGEPYSLLMKPIAQMALVDALVNATKEDKMTFDQAITKANKIDWNIEAKIWKNVLVKGDQKIDQGKSARNRAAALMTYFIAGNKLTEDEHYRYLREYQNSFSKRKNIPEDESKWQPFPEVS